MQYLCDLKHSSGERPRSRSRIHSATRLIEHTRCARLDDMPTATITRNNLRKIVTESVHNALSSELMKLRALALPTVSQREQREIEKSLRRADRSIGKRISVTV